MSDDDRLLLQILAQVPFDGWTRKTLDAVDPTGAEVRRLFPGGIADVVTQFADWADRQMEARLAEVELGEFRIRDTIALLVKARLEALAPYRDVVRQEAAWVALHPDLGMALVWRSADRMWRLAGDTATDFNHYSKRALLVGVIASTTLCWLGDTTPDNEASWRFLDRRIDNVMGIGKAMGQAKKLNPTRLMETVAGFAARVRYRS